MLIRLPTNCVSSLIFLQVQVIRGIINMIIFTIANISLCLPTAWTIAFLGFLPVVNNVIVILAVVPGH